MSFITTSPGQILRTNSIKVANGLVDLADIASLSSECFNVFSKRLRSNRKRSQVRKLSEDFVKAEEKLNQDLSRPKTISERIFFNCVKNFHTAMRSILERVHQLIPFGRGIIKGDILVNAQQQLHAAITNTLPCILNNIAKNLKPKPAHVSMH